METNKTVAYLGKDVDLRPLFVERKDFCQYKRIRINTLAPRQPEIDLEVLRLKLKGKRYTTPYVAICQDVNILIDGHHTVIAKKLRGYKYIYALCAIIN